MSTQRAREKVAPPFSARHASRDGILGSLRMSMAETKCAKWRRKSVPVCLIKKGDDSLAWFRVERYQPRGA